VAEPIRGALVARLAAGTLVIALVFALSGCGSGSDDPKPRAAGGGDLRDIEKSTVDKATRAQIERFAKIRIPASATKLRSASRSAMDTQLLVSFVLPRKDLAAFVRSGHFGGELRDGDRAIASSVGSEIGWRLKDAKRVEGLAEIVHGLGRNLVVVLDDPQRPLVHLEAMTI